MLITTYIPKGGEGKTSLSYSLTIDLGNWFYFTNDKINSVVPNIYNNNIDEIEKKHYQDNNNLLFDGGGFLETKMKNVLKGSDLIIIPFSIDDSNSYNSLFNYINELERLNIDFNKLIFVCNKLQKEDFNKYKEQKQLIINKGIKEENILFLRFTKLFKKTFKEKKSILEIIESSNNKSIYDNIYKEYINLLNKINTKLNNN